MIAMALARTADTDRRQADHRAGRHSARVLSLIQEMQDEFKLSMILITHALGVVAHMVDYIHIMYWANRGSGPTLEIFESKHPYTRGLLNSIRSCGRRVARQLYPRSSPSAYSLPEVASSGELQ